MLLSIFRVVGLICVAMMVVSVFGWCRPAHQRVALAKQAMMKQNLGARADVDRLPMPQDERACGGTSLVFEIDCFTTQQKHDVPIVHKNFPLHDRGLLGWEGRLCLAPIGRHIEVRHVNRGDRQVFVQRSGRGRIPGVNFLHNV